MFDLHSHSILSDGELLPSELARRAEDLGIKGLVISDHVDVSNIDFVVPRLAKVSRQLSAVMKLVVKPGAELTHVIPSELPGLTARARELGAELVLVHGETIVEPVLHGTNRAGIESGADVLTHPGLISEEDASLAAELGVGLEISARKGHSLTNGHVAKVARETGAVLVFGSDAHSSGDLLDRAEAEKVAMGAGLGPDEVRELFGETERLFRGQKESLKR
ncbi:MAG: histidinol phosphate phosphatase domain-containing protein [Candidatus Brocadiales bacterium]